MKTTNAPIALFVYNRPWHTRQTLEALVANAEANRTDLYVFSDAPRTSADTQAVAEVRSYLRTISGFQSITMVEREINLGLAKSIVDGVTRVCDAHGRVIVLEDDLVTSPYFLDFVNKALDFYERDDRVVSIAGYSFPLSCQLASSTYFLKGTNSWGWATWKRGWDQFEADARRLLDQLHQARLSREFDIGGAYPYTNMLNLQVAGKIDSWAIRWHASAFLRDRLTLYPSRSLVRNIGLDGSGVHCSRLDFNPFEVELSGDPVSVASIAVEEDTRVRKCLEAYFRRVMRMRWWNAIRRPRPALKRLLGMR